MDTKSAVRLLSEARLRLILFKTISTDRKRRNMQTVVRILKMMIIKLIIYLLNKTVIINSPQFNRSCVKNTSNCVQFIFL